MTLQTELFNAILSMDAYNRGYNASITLTGNGIGNATLGIDSSELGTVIQNGTEIDKHETVGFYALAYNYNGETIISFRGTNDVDSPGDLLTSKDVYHGWTAFFGLYWTVKTVSLAPYGIRTRVAAVKGENHIHN